MDRKRRKIENENRQFCPDWMDLYCFILPDQEAESFITQ
jgi:hypothetical protein